MGFDPREFIQRLRETNPEIRDACPETFEAYVRFHEQALTAGQVDARTKELAALAVSVYSKCPYCVPYHVQRALAMGITREEMIEIGMVAASVGGGATMTYVSMMVQAINELTNIDASPESL
ncbi:MAG: Carboxymuconolactone decarboxylase family protein [bacterium ADurb.Bin429]|nr:MAG: Carboxymuconolactone decarboxylase family protein [bacterium ADurb.Bin429]